MLKQSVLALVMAFGVSVFLFGALKALAQTSTPMPTVTATPSGAPQTGMER